MNRIVSSITSSPVWRFGNNAIVIVWDENDYSGLANAPSSTNPFLTGNLNQVVLTVQTNSPFGPKGVQSQNFYTSFSLLKSIEDPNVSVMSDLFGAGRW